MMTIPPLLPPDSFFATSLRQACGPLMLGLLLVGNLFAEPPKIDRIFPRGLQRGLATKLTLTGKPGDAPLQVWCDRPGFQGEFSEKKDELTLTLPEDTLPGVAFLRFYNPSGATDLIPMVVGISPEVNETEPNNSTAQAQKCALPLVVNGVLHRNGEVDTFVVPLQAGDRLVASVESRRIFNSPADMVVQVLGPAGNTIAQNDDHHGIDPQVSHVATIAGDHFVRVFSFPADPNSTINFAGGDDYVYRLTLTTGPFLNFLTPEVTPDLLAAPGLHWGLPQLDLTTFRSVTPAAEQALEASPRVAWIGSLTEPGSTPTVKLKATKDETYRIQVQAREIGSSLDPVLEVTSLDGKSLKDVDDASRSQLDVDFTWKAPDTAEYLLKVTDRFGHAGDNFFFHLLVDRELPQCSLSVGSENFVLPADKPLEIPVDLSRTGGFEETLTVTAIDLPEGVILTEATSEPKGDSAKKVTLKLEAGTSTAFSGPIRIVARTAGESPQEFTATSATKAKGFRTATLWLTR